jgi:hypothetical protein
MLRGGLQEGRWQICYDPGRDIYNRDSADMVERLRGRVHWHTYQLKVNCRNTSVIAIYNRLLTGIDCGRPRLKLFKPEVKVQSCVFRTKSNTHSGANRTLVSDQNLQAFRWKPNTNQR